MIKQMISTLVEAGLKVEFIQLPEAEHVTAIIVAPEIEHPRGIASHKNPEVALAIAASRGLASIYNRARLGFISLEATCTCTVNTGKPGFASICRVHGST